MVFVAAFAATMVDAIYSFLSFSFLSDEKSEPEWYSKPLCPPKVTVSTEGYSVHRRLLCPPLVTVQAMDEDCHRLIRRTCL